MISEDRIRLEYVSEFKYLGCGLDKSGTYEVLHESLLLPVLIFGSETMI